MADVNERYDNLDGLRVISCLCIIAMHIRANAEYNLHPIFDTIVASWTQFVPLFMIISGFGMFCGYYERFKTQSIDLNSFYSKRYKKLLPYFITLILIDIAVERSLASVIEGITEATLVFGLLPNNEHEVIGVSWTLGVIFLFYMLFPFIVYLCWNRKRSWMTFLSSIVLSSFCSIYYFTDKYVIESFTPRHNFLYCAPYFIGGGIVYLYRDCIKKNIENCRWLWLFACISLSVVWYLVPGGQMIKNIILFLPWLMYAVSVESKFLNNRVMSYFSRISLELYLTQMIVFRIVEKANCLYIAGNGWTSFVLAWIIVIIGLVLFIEVWKRLRITAIKMIK